jgi:hypothetical protein
MDARLLSESQEVDDNDHRVDDAALNERVDALARGVEGDDEAPMRAASSSPMSGASSASSEQGPFMSLSEFLERNEVPPGSAAAHGGGGGGVAGAGSPAAPAAAAAVEIAGLPARPREGWLMSNFMALIRREKEAWRCVCARDFRAPDSRRRATQKCGRRASCHVLLLVLCHSDCHLGTCRFANARVQGACG